MTVGRTEDRAPATRHRQHASARASDFRGPARAFYSQTVRLIERTHELNALSRALDRALGGTGVGLAICGEPGAGKSALVEVACAQATGLRMLRGACDPLATPRPLGPFRDLLADLGSLDRDASLAEVCEATTTPGGSSPRCWWSRTCTGSTPHRSRCCGSWSADWRPWRAPSSSRIAKTRSPPSTRPVRCWVTLRRPSTSAPFGWLH